MSPLVRKEALAAAPYFLLLLFLTTGLALVDAFFFHAPDQYAFVPIILRPDSREDYQAVLLLLIMALGSGLLIREMDDRTLRFLDSLPVSRTRLFFVKVTVNLAALDAALGIDLVAMAILRRGFGDSLSRPYPFGLIVEVFFATALALLALLSLALLLSFLRRLSWLAMALLLIGYNRLCDHFPLWQIANPFRFLERLVDDRGHFPWTQFAALVGGTALFLAAAWALYQRREAFRPWIVRRLREGWPRRIALFLAVAATAGAWVWFIASASDSDESPSKASEVGVSDRAIRQVRTEDYHFAFPENLKDRVAPLIADSGAVYGEVQRLFGTRAHPVIRVDASSVQGANFLGFARLKNIQLAIDRMDEPAERRAVLAHETAHVFINELSGGVLADAEAWSSFFHEGVATRVDQHFDPREEDVRRLRFQSAFAHARWRIPVEEVMESVPLRRQYRPELVYAFGERFALAMEEEYGAPSWGRLLASLGRKDRPKSLSGMARWRDAFEHAGLSLDRVLARYGRGLVADRERWWAQIQAVPEIAGMLEPAKGGRVALKARLPKEWKGGLPRALTLRLDDDTEPDYWRRYNLGEGEDHVTLDKRDWPTVEYQFAMTVTLGGPTPVRVLAWMPWSKSLVVR